jgi:hypothetical protein
VIKVDSFVPPLSEFPILLYLIQTLRAVIVATVPEEYQDSPDVALESLDAHGRLIFTMGDRFLCRIPLAILQRAEASFLSRTN